MGVIYDMFRGQRVCVIVFVCLRGCSRCCWQTLCSLRVQSALPSPCPPCPPCPSLPFSPLCLQREANHLVEEFMLLANMTTAAMVAEHFPDR